MYQQGYNGLFPNNYYNRGQLENVKCGNRLKVFGQGIVSVQPDAAEMVIGITTENSQLEVAQKENAKITQQVLESMKSMGVLEKDIQTQNYNIRTQYDYIEGKQVFRGYEVSNDLKVLVRNINDVGEIIDTAIKNGANNVDYIKFIVSNPSIYYDKALRLAIEDAQNKAIAIANKLKVNVNIVPIQITEQKENNIVPLATMAFKSTAVTTPIEAGENKITAAIEGIFIYF